MRPNLDHVGPAVQDGENPFSRLLDLRWAEAALAHLKDQDDYLAKRRNVGKVATTIQKQMQRGDQGPRRRQRTSQRARRTRDDPSAWGLG